jgi:Ca2+-binding RTX toxin-like protein
MSTTSNPNFAEATGNAQFFDYSHAATNSLTAAELSALVEGGVASAIANANATFITDPAFTSLFTETSGTGQSGTSYYVESQSQTQVIATFDVSENQTFSFDFNAEINLSVKEIETSTEANEANSKISFIVLDTSNINQPQVIDYFGIVGELISGQGIADVDFGSSNAVNFTTHEVIDLDGDNGIDFINADVFSGTYERTFNTSTHLTLVKLNASEIELFGDVNETLKGDNRNNILEGGDGNDTLQGFDGNDTLRGGNGNDLLDGGYGFDLLDGGAGNDTVTYDFYYGNVYADLGTGVVTFPGNSYIPETLTSVENIIGADGHDQLTGDSADNLLEGGTGNDTLDGKNGQDTLSGGSGDDRLYGDSGNDTLMGGSGDDYIRGGWGNDQFIFEQGNSFLYREFDRIVDFRTGSDQIEFHHCSGLSSFNQLKGYISYYGWWDTLIELNTGGKLLIEDVKPYQLSASDFKFV